MKRAEGLRKRAPILSDEELCDYLDREFIFGCWRHEFEEVSPDLLRNLRGFLILLAKK